MHEADQIAKKVNQRQETDRDSVRFLYATWTFFSHSSLHIAPCRDITQSTLCHIHAHTIPYVRILASISHDKQRQQEEQKKISPFVLCFKRSGLLYLLG